jgi:pimeloyl-ACP methyl ester carboxylesterase
MVIQISPRRRAVGASEPCHDVVVDGVRLAYDDEGEGPPLVCLHAIGHGAGDFAGLRRRLAGRHRVIALDWPGHGSSDDDRVPASAGRYTVLLAGVLDALGIERAIILGNSIGGAVAIRFAAAHPDRVRALVLANPGGLDRGGGGRLNRAVTGMMARFFAAGARGARWYPGAFAAYYRIVLTEPAAREQRDRIVAQAGDVACVLHDAWRSFGEPEADVRALAPAVTCPVLFAWAARDRINQLARCRAAIGLFPDARLETFRAGHAAFLEAPDAFAAALEPFLALAQSSGSGPGQSATIASPSTRIGMRKSERPHGGPATHSPVSGR